MPPSRQEGRSDRRTASTVNLGVDEATRIIEHRPLTDPNHLGTIGGLSVETVEDIRTDEHACR